MKKTRFTRIMSFVLALAMAFTMLPELGTAAKAADTEITASHIGTVNVGEPIYGASANTAPLTVNSNFCKPISQTTPSANQMFQICDTNGNYGSGWYANGTFSKPLSSFNQKEVFFAVYLEALNGYAFKYDAASERLDNNSYWGQSVPGHLNAKASVAGCRFDHLNAMFIRDITFINKVILRYSGRYVFPAEISKDDEPASPNPEEDKKAGKPFIDGSGALHTTYGQVADYVKVATIETKNFRGEPKMEVIWDNAAAKPNHLEATTDGKVYVGADVDTGTYRFKIRATDTKADDDGTVETVETSWSTVYVEKAPRPDLETNVTVMVGKTVTAALPIDENGGTLGTPVKEGGALVNYKVNNGEITVTAAGNAIPGSKAVVKIPVGESKNYLPYTILSNINIVAVPTYNVTVVPEKDPQGKPYGEPFSDPIVSPEGDTVVVYPNPTRPGYEPVKVTVTPDDKTKKPFDATPNGDVYTFPMPNSDVTVTVDYEPIHYKITVDNSGNKGTGVTACDKTSEIMGNRVDFTTVPEKGYEVTKAVVYNETTKETTEVTDNFFMMPASDVVIKAIYAPKVYNVTVNPSDDGEPEANPNKGTAGTPIEVTPNPKPGYEPEKIIVTPVSDPKHPTEVTKPNKDGDFPFEMPKDDVIVDVVYKPIQYKITVDNSQNKNMGVTSCDKKTESVGNRVDFKTTPEKGYEVAKAVVYNETTKTETVVTGNTFTMPASDVVIKAVYEPKVYKVTVNPSDEGNPAADPKEGVAGTPIKVDPNPKPGYEPEKIIVTPASDPKHPTEVTKPDKNGDFPFEMPKDDVTVDVVYKPIPYDITVKDIGKGKTTTDPEDEGTVGTPVTIKPVPNKGNTVDTITVQPKNGDPIKPTKKSDGTYEFPMPPSDVVVTVKYKPVDYIIYINQKPNGVTKTNKSEDDDLTQDYANAGEEIEILPQPKKGYTVDKVEVKPESKNTPAIEVGKDNSFWMPTDNVYVTVTYKPAKYDITVKDPEHGKPTTNPEDEAPMGDTVTINPNPDRGYEVDKVTVTPDDGSDPIKPTKKPDGTYEFPMPPADVTVSVEYTPIDYEIEVIPTPNGKTTTDPEDKAPMKKEVTVTPVPQDGYVIQGITVTNVTTKKPIQVTPDGDQFTFTMPDSKVTVKVDYAPKKPDSGVDDYLNTGDHILYIRGYPEGDVRPNGNITRAEVAMIFYRLLLQPDVKITKTFSDVPNGKWYTEAVNTMASMGITNGYPNGTFKPNQPITRAELTAMAIRFAKPLAGTSNFKDVPSSYWAASAIGTASSYGWITGYSDGTFRPKNNITRAETAVIVNRMLERQADISYVTVNQHRLVQFTDLQDPNKWYYKDMVEATNAHDFEKVYGTEIWTGLRKQ